MKALIFITRTSGQGSGRLAIFGWLLFHPKLLKRSANTQDRFGWANGMFGQKILDVEKKFPSLLLESYQSP